MKEYQAKKLKSYVLPETVYRQALWAIKDLPRLKEKRAVLSEEVDSIPSPVMERIGTSNKVSDTTGDKAVDLTSLNNRIRAIEEPLLLIPERYRDGIIKKLAFGVPYGCQFHPNTWKKWQQIYIYYVAENLMLC